MLLEAAIHSAAKVGNANLKIADIAVDVGCTEEQARAHFATETALVEAIPDYLRRRLATYMTAPADALDTIRTAGERLLAYGEAYVDYLNKDPELFQYLFEMRSGLEPGQIETALDGGEMTNQSLSTLLKTIEDFARECGNPDPARDMLIYSSLCAWSTAHGLAHLSLIGVLRHQHAAVRRYNYRTVLEAFTNSLSRKFANNYMLKASPLFTTLRPVVEDYTAHLTNYAGQKASPDMDESLLRAIAMDTAIELIGTDGLETLTVQRLAAAIHLPVDVVRQLVDNEFELRERAEIQTDSEMAQQFTMVFDKLPDDCSAVDRLRAMAVAYFQYAVHDPARFKAMIALGSKSVVPNSSLGHDVDMGEAFRVLSDLCHQTLVEMGQTPTDQQVYIKTLMLWAGANGACHLFTSGDLRDLDLELKWDFMAEIIEYVIYMFQFDLKA